MKVMLFGNIVFIKKSGGDGSKYPVTEKNIKIGRSEDCLIRIHNPQVASEHCQLIVDDNGQAKLRYISKVAVINGKQINQEDVTLCHGDVFKLGERLARWEYVPSSKYYRQSLSPTGRLVAVVTPQQRSIVRNILHNNNSICSVERISSVAKNQKPMSNVAKFMSGRHSLLASKILCGSKVKQRKSIPGIISSKSPKPEVVESGRKSTMASWKVNIVSPLSSGRATQRKSTPIKKPLPMKSFDKLMQSGRKSTIKPLDLKTIDESPPKEEVKEEASPRSTRSMSRSPPVKENGNLELEALSLLVTPGRKSVSKSERLFNSEKKFTKRSSLKTAKGLKRSSLVLKPLDKTPVKGVVKKLYENLSKSTLSHDISQGNVKNVRNFLTKVVDSNTVIERPASVSLIETPSNGRRISNKSSPKTSSGKNTPTRKTPTKSRKSSKAVTPVVDTLTVSSEEKMTSSARRSPASRKSSRSSKSLSVSSMKKTPSARKSLSDIKEKSSPRGVRRKLSPSISSAERAAKKLKTSSPTKPDKNKKAALLVLGKANRKQVLSQNLKVLLKQKIVKKAIKQSVPPPIRKGEAAAKTSVKNVKKKSKKKAVKRKKISTKKSPSNKRKSPPKISKVIKESEAQKTSTPLLSSSSKNQTPKEEKKISGRKSISRSSVIQTPPSFSSKTPSKQGKKQESSTTSFSLSEQSTSELIPDVKNSINLSSNYLFNSYRRTSKRLSSMNDMGRPDFTELSPTALGLMPKSVEIFRSPKEGERRSISLATPKTFLTAGIVKSASTSKVGSRKMVRFSSKDISFGSGLLTPNTSKGTDFDFESIQTPNITMDRFVSPLVNESFESFSENEMSGKVSTFPGGEMQRKKEASSTYNVKSPRSEPKRTKCVRQLLLSFQPKNGLSRTSLLRQDSKNTKTQRSPKTELTYTTEVQELLETPQTQKTVKDIRTNQAGKSVKEDLNITEDVRKLSVVVKGKKSPKNDLSNVKGVSRLLRTPKVVNSPKNDLSDVRGVKKLLKTPKVQKSPKNDLTDVRGVKKLLKTPKVQKSPKNDLTDVGGVKKLLKTPKVQKSPKNDLTDVRGVKKLLKTPKVQKSPKNDLSDVRGVKKLLKTPKVQKSPKNDLTDVRGVKKLLKTPKVQKSPKNDLSDVRGVKKLLKTPKVQKSPKNDLSDVRGVKKLMKTPKVQKSPKNDLSDVRGVKKLLKTPKVQKSPKNDLTDVRGVRNLLKTPRAVKSPKNDLTDVAGVKRLLRTPRTQKSPENNLTDLYGVRELFKSPRAVKSPKNELTDLRGVRQLLTSPKPRKSPKNDLSDLTGVKKLMTTPRAQKSPKNDLTNVSFNTQIFESPLAQTTSVNEMRAGEEMVKKSSVRSFRSSFSDGAEMKQITIANNVSDLPEESNRTKNISRIKSFKSIRGRRTIHWSPKSPKNDLSDVEGVKELFSSYQSSSDLNIGLSEFSESFVTTNSQTESWKRQRVGERTQRIIKEEVQERVVRTKKPTARRIVKETASLIQETIPRTTRTRRNVDVEMKSEITNEETVVASTRAKGGKSVKRKAVDVIETSAPKKKAARVEVSPVVVKSQRSARSGKSKPKDIVQSTEEEPVTKRSRTNKISKATSVVSPPKLRRRVAATETATKGSSKKMNTKRKVALKTKAPKEKTTEVSVDRNEVSTNEKAKRTSRKTATSKVQTKTTKSVSKTSAKSTSKVQKGRSQIKSTKEKQSKSSVKISPRKTRSASARGKKTQV